MDPRYIADLARSGISPEDAEAAGMFYVENAQTIFPEFKALPALVIPYYHHTDKDEQGLLPLTFVRQGEVHHFCRVRYLRLPPAPKGTKQQRYDQPWGSGVQAYFSPLMDWPKIFALDNEPIFFTEGEKKAGAGAALGYPVIGLGGVYNFRDKASGNEFLPILANIPWYDRTVYIVYDSDYSSNPDVRLACDRLAAELSLKRGAKVKLVVLPSGPRGADGKPGKMGLDDYLVAYGVDAFEKLIKDAPDLRKTDAEVLAMNDKCAFIEADGMIYDFTTRAYIDKASFLSGSEFSKHKITQASPEGNKVKTVSLASVWLTHESHLVYRDTTFDPSTNERTVERVQGGVSLNLWGGMPESAPGDIQPFLDLNEYVFSLLPPQDRDLALKLLIWKWQNPDKLPGIAITMLGVGAQGGGKSLWAKIAMMVFGPYGNSQPSSVLVSEFNPWLEEALCVIFDEAEAEYVSSAKGSSKLKKYICDDVQNLRDLYRKGRQIKNRAMIILTSNEGAVGNHEEGDRRMFVVNCPRPHPEGKPFYQRVGKWMEGDGILHLRHWLGAYDLKGWSPPASPPMTAEKRMAEAEGRTVTQKMGMQMREAKGDGYIIGMLDAMRNWADANETSSNAERAARAKDIMVFILNWPIRPYYTPEELAIMLPEIATRMGYTKGMGGNVAGQISKDLRSVQIPYLINHDNPEGFLYQGYRQQFLICSHFDEYANKPMTQAEFDRMAGSWTTYGQYRLASASAQGLQGRRLTTGGQTRPFDPTIPARQSPRTWALSLTSSP